MKHKDKAIISREAMAASRAMGLKGGQGRDANDIIDGALLLAGVFAFGTTILLFMALVELWFGGAG